MNLLRQESRDESEHRDQQAHSPGRTIASRRVITLVALAAIALVYACTLYVRVPRLDNPVAYNRHGEGAARTIRHMRIWDEEGLLETRFMMRTTGIEPGDRYIADIGYLSDGEGTYYYVSFPPLFPLLPFLAFKAVGAPIDALSLRVFALALHLAAAILLFLLTRHVLRARGEPLASIAGVFAASVLLLSPGPLWYYSNAYDASSLETVLLLACVYLAVRLFDTEDDRRWLAPAFAASSFALAYTEWTGILFAVSLGILALLKRDRVAVRVFLLGAGGTALALGLMVAQYSSVAGLGAYIEALTGKAEMRITLGDAVHHSITSWPSWQHLLGWVRKGYSPGLLTLAALGVAWLLSTATSVAATGDPRAKLLNRIRDAFPRPYRLALAIAVMPAALHLLSLFSHAVIHDFDLLKWSIPLGLLVGGFAAEMVSQASTSRGRAVAVAAVVLVLAIGVREALPTALKRDFSVDPAAKRVGSVIGEAEIDPAEVVFVNAPPKFYMGSATVYYARRSLARYSGPEAAAVLMRASGAPGGVVFVVGGDLSVEHIERIAPDGRVLESEAYVEP